MTARLLSFLLALAVIGMGWAVMALGAV